MRIAVSSYRDLVQADLDEWRSLDCPGDGLAFLRRDRGDDREILRPDLGWIELADVRGHPREKLGHRHRRLLALLRRYPADWVAARDHDLPEVRALHPALLQGLHVHRDTIVDVHETHRPLLALAQRGGKRRVHEPIDAPEHRLVRGAREAVALLVGRAEREKRR